MIPTPGRIVLYTLTASDAQQIASNRTRRGDSGNAASAGQVYPLVITRVWAESPTAETSVNGQVLLDGDDALWVTSRQQWLEGDREGHWADPRA